MNETLPTTVQIDAWAGEPARSTLRPDARRWGAKAGLLTQDALEFGAPPSDADWEHEDVGYGILVPDTPPFEWTAEKASGASLPAPLRRLLAARPSTVLLYWHDALGTRRLRRYGADRSSASDLRIGLSDFGVARNRLPRYVLIAASPERIPWNVQFALSLRHAVGRLPFDDDASAPYIEAMLDGAGWAGSPPAVSSVAMWTVDHGSDDITHLMKAVLTKPLIAACAGTIDHLTVLDDADATAEGLMGALDARPTLLVTSSHGATPLDERDLRRDLGLPVALDHEPVDLDALTSAMPGGAVWFAQACCSAGSSHESSFASLLDDGTMARRIVDAVAALEPSVAPAPLALLRRDLPVRGVFGHVEPTFDWTLRDDVTKQKFGHRIVAGLTSRLHAGMPLGLVLSEYYADVASLVREWFEESDRFKVSHDRQSLVTMTRLRLAAWDRQSLVLLGDPTVNIPAIVGSRAGG